MKVRWIRRNKPVAPVPYIVTEDGLPAGQKAVVFLPHSDDGRYIGCSLHFMNRQVGDKPANDMSMVVVSPGYRSVEGDMSKAAKTEIREAEALCWATNLGFGREQVLFFRAEKTYAACGRINREDRSRMVDYIRSSRPTMVFVPHISDTAQHININTRRMVLSAVTGWIAQEYEDGHVDRNVLVVEYPSNHVPILPPADKNFIMALTDTAHADIKHKANACHESQQMKGFDMMARFVEAIDALGGADDVLQRSRLGRRMARQLSGTNLLARKSRGEHFGVTELRVKDDGATPVIVEERLKFPLSPSMKKRWAMQVG